jgi:hypothetical protein
MIERYRDAYFVLVCQLHEVPIKHAVVQNVKMAESSPFGVSSGPRCELDVSSIFKIYRPLSVIQFLGVSLCIDFRKVFKVKHTFYLCIPDQYDILQISEISNFAKV